MSLSVLRSIVRDGADVCAGDERTAATRGRKPLRRHRFRAAYETVVNSRETAVGVAVVRGPGRFGRETFNDPLGVWTAPPSSTFVFDTRYSALIEFG